MASGQHESIRVVQIFSAILMLASASRTMADSPTDRPQVPTHYFYFKERRELPLDSARLAVRKRLGAADDIATTCSRAGVLAPENQALPIAPWFVIGNPATDRSSDAIERRLDALAKSADLAFVSPVYIGSDGGPVIVTPTLVVGFANSIDDKQARAILENVGAGTVQERDWAGMRGVYRIQSNSRRGDQVLSASNALAARPEVRFAEPDMIFTGKSEIIPNDPLFPQCWGLHNTGQSGGTADMDMNAPEAWDITTGSPSIITVVLDVGVQQNHPDLNQIPGSDFTGQGGNGGPLNACENHGTAVAGCISAIINNAIGVPGIAPNARVASARTFVGNLSPCNGTWTAQGSWTVNALAWAQSIGARVTNNSNGYGFSSSAIESMYDQTHTNGIVHFASAGNDASTTITYPASVPVVNAVAALNRNGNLASFSNSGVGIDFSAPGQSIVTTDRTGSDGYAGGDYATVDGTSFASPYTAGVAALVFSKRPTLTAPEAEQLLQATCRDIGNPGYDTTFGWGFVNAGAALFLLGDCNNNGIDDAVDIANHTSADCDADAQPDECQVPPLCLTCPDCQGDGIPDACQIPPLCPGCANCNSNAIPDACEPDCNMSGTPDDCDIALGLSQDCQPNNLPDECELPPLCVQCPDCNHNGVPDECDIALGNASDCNANFIPDRCETDPALCGANCLPDCDHNFAPDACQIAGTYSNQSPDLSPLLAPIIQTHTLIAPPAASGNVTLLFRAVGDIDSSSELVAIDVNGIPVGNAFAFAAFACPLTNVDTLTVSAATWNAAVAGGNAAINMVPNVLVDNPCGGSTRISVQVDYPTAVGDCNANGQLDACELAAGNVSDCNANGVPDGCDITAGLLSDFDQDNRPDECGCGAFCRGDLDLDFVVDGRDVQPFIACIASGNLAANDCGCADLNNDLRLDAADASAFVGKLLTDVDLSCP